MRRPVWIGIGAVVVLVIGTLAGQKGSSGPPPDSPLAHVSLRDIRWTKDYSIMTLATTIVNDNAFAVRDVEITCKHSAPSGTQIDSNTRTVYEIVPAKGTNRISEFNMGFINHQAVSTACSVTRLKP